MGSAAQRSLRRTLLPLLAVCASVLPTAAAHPRNVFLGATLAIPSASPAADPAAETLVQDDRVPVLANGHWSIVAQNEAVLRRQATDDDASSATNRKATATVTATRAATRAATAATAVATAAATMSSLPTFYDTSLGANFSTGSVCPNYIKSFLADETFQSCYPFSMLMQGSRSFFNAAKSLVTVTQVLDATCAANATFCVDYLDELAANLTSADACGADYNLGNAVVVQAYNGMKAYQPLYAASCLKDATSGAYCYANAITNATTPANVYFYFLPVNVSLPGGSVPSCNTCLSQTMALFQAAAADRSAMIADTYAQAAQTLVTLCGPTFANVTLPEAAVSGASTVAATASLLVPALVALALFL